MPTSSLIILSSSLVILISCHSPFYTDLLVLLISGYAYLIPDYPELLPGLTNSIPDHTSVNTGQLTRFVYKDTGRRNVELQVPKNF